jgi:hypothetical protein
MKSTLVYYLYVFLPILALIFLISEGYFNSFEFVSGLFTYVIIYRPVIDFLRLKLKGILNASDWGKNYFIGYITNRYFVQLFTNY